MRKLILLLLAAPMLLLGACNDDDEASDVDISVAYQNAVGLNGVLYTVQGQELAITALTVSTTDNVPVAISGAEYYWDGIPAGTTVTEPFGAAFDTSLYSVGDHFIKIRVGVYEQGYAPTFSVITLPVEIVATAADLPAGATSGSYLPEQ